VQILWQFSAQYNPTETASAKILNGERTSLLQRVVVFIKDVKTGVGGGEENASGRIQELGDSYAIGALMLKFAKFRMLSSGSCASIFSSELTLRLCVVTSDVLLFRLV